MITRSALTGSAGTAGANRTGPVSTCTTTMSLIKTAGLSPILFLTLRNTEICSLILWISSQIMFLEKVTGSLGAIAFAMPLLPMLVPTIFIPSISDLIWTIFTTLTTQITETGMWNAASTNLCENAHSKQSEISVGSA